MADQRTTSSDEAKPCLRKLSASSWTGNVRQWTGGSVAACSRSGLCHIGMMTVAKRKARKKLDDFTMQRGRNSLFAAASLLAWYDRNAPAAVAR